MPRKSEAVEYLCLLVSISPPTYTPNFTENMETLWQSGIDREMGQYALDAQVALFSNLIS
jgi:hypothetical protein